MSKQGVRNPISRPDVALRLGERGLSIHDSGVRGRFRLAAIEREAILRPLLPHASRQQALLSTLCSVTLPLQHDAEAREVAVRDVVEAALPEFDGSDRQETVVRALLGLGFPLRAWPADTGAMGRVLAASIPPARLDGLSTDLELAGRLLRFVDALERHTLPLYVQQWLAYADGGFKGSLHTGVDNVAKRAAELAQCLRTLPTQLYSPLDAFLCERVAFDAVAGMAALEDLARLAEHLGVQRAGRLAGITLLLDMLAEASVQTETELQPLLAHKKTAQLMLTVGVAADWRAHLPGMPRWKDKDSQLEPEPFAAILRTLTKALSQVLGERLHAPGRDVRKEAIERVFPTDPDGQATPAAAGRPMDGNATARRQR